MRASRRRMALGGALILGTILVASLPRIFQGEFRRDLTRIAQPEPTPTPLPGQPWMSPAPLPYATDNPMDGHDPDSFPVTVAGQTHNPHERSRNIFVPENAVSPDKRGYLVFEFSKSRSSTDKVIPYGGHLIPLEAGAPARTWARSYDYGMVEPVCAWLPDGSGFLEIFDTTMQRDIRLNRLTNVKETLSLTLCNSLFLGTPRFLSRDRVIVPMAGPTSGSEGRAVIVCEEEFEITRNGLRKIGQDEKRALPFSRRSAPLISRRTESVMFLPSVRSLGRTIRCSSTGSSALSGAMARQTGRRTEASSG